MLAPPKPPASAELEALIKEARERQLRRRLLGAAGVAIATAIGLSVYAFTIGGGVINVGQPAAQGGRATGPPCRASQLSASAALQGAGGSMLGVAVLTNTSAKACSLPGGPPNVRVVWRSRIMPTRQTRGMAVSGETPVRVLAPRTRAAVYMQWRNWCGTPSEGTYISPIFRLRFRGGLTLEALAQEMSPPHCDSSGITSSLAVSRVLTDG